MKELLTAIRQIKFHNAGMFAEPLQFSSGLIRWLDEREPGHYNRNFFQTVGDVSSDDLESVISFQKNQRLRGFILKSEEALPRDLVKNFALSEEKQLLLLQSEDSSWTINPDIIIRDSQLDDISADLLDAVMNLSTNPYTREWLRRAMEECLDTAKVHPEYHWLAAYEDGKLVGRCYALCAGALTQMEDLWVHPGHRRKHIATTLIHHAASFGGQVFCHTEEGGRALVLYEKLGFVPIATVYEYQKEWEL